MIFNEIFYYTKKQTNKKGLEGTEAKIYIQWY